MNKTKCFKFHFRGHLWTLSSYLCCQLYACATSWVTVLLTPLMSKCAIKILCPMASRLFQNCQSKNCAVHDSRIDSTVTRIDSIVINRLDCDKNRLDCAQIDSICVTFDSIVSTIDSVKKNDSIVCQVPLNIY